MLVLLLIALATGPSERCRSRGCRTTVDLAEGRGFEPTPTATPLFEFAPVSGAGMGTACACSAITGSKGEVVTVTRASSGACLKGATTSGIANGDMVTCSTNQPRVMPGGDGSGGLGLLVEGARTNGVVQNKAMDGAPWVAAQVGGRAVPTVTADAAAGPDGTTTADRIVTDTCVAGSTASVVYQDYTGTAAAWAGTFWIRGTSGSGSVSIYYWDPTAATGNAIQCSYVSTGWTRCGEVGGTLLTKTFANTTHRIGIGCQNDTVTGHTSTGAADVLVSGAQTEAGAFPSSTIFTAGATVTRASESLVATLPVAMNAQRGSHAVTFVPEWSTSQASPYLVYYDSEARPLYDNTGDSINLWDGTNDTALSVIFAPSVPRRFWSTYSAGASQVSDGVSSITGGFDGIMGLTPLTSMLICQGAGVFAFGVCKQICADPDPTRCR